MREVNKKRVMRDALRVGWTAVIHAEKTIVATGSYREQVFRLYYCTDTTCVATYSVDTKMFRFWMRGAMPAPNECASTPHLCVAQWVLDRFSEQEQ